jgi:phenylalanyl-tRNA synthetase alpha chain
MAESLQQLILDTLDSSGEIKDTRNLTIPGQSSPAASHDGQIAILGALNSLLSREVLLITK